MRWINRRKNHSDYSISEESDQTYEHRSERKNKLNRLRKRSRNAGFQQLRKNKSLQRSSKEISQSRTNHSAYKTNKYDSDSDECGWKSNEIETDGWNNSVEILSQAEQLRSERDARPRHRRSAVKTKRSKTSLWSAIVIISSGDKEHSQQTCSIWNKTIRVSQDSKLSIVTHYRTYHKDIYRKVLPADYLDSKRDILNSFVNKARWKNLAFDHI